MTSEQQGDPVCARWERMEESPDYVVWRKRWDEGYSESITIPKEVEAAIRRPLEERVRTANAVEEHMRTVLHEVYAHRDALEEERDRLRAALRPFAALLDVAMDDKPDDAPVWSFNANVITCGDLRRALAETSEGDGS